MMNQDDIQSLTNLVNATSGSNQPQTMYTPTPQELAYGLYVLKTVFPTSHQLYGAQQCIAVAGQDAVKFLTTSGIHRLILRILWTVVDPHNSGTLSQIQQWHTILRLVALTQAGHVESALLKVGTMPPPKPAPAQVVGQILQRHLHTVVPLARFDVVSIPSDVELQQLYAQHMAAATTATPSTSTPSRAHSVSPTPQWQPPLAALSPPRPQSVSPVPTWQQQQQGPSPFGATPAPEPQGMAAFDALVEGVVQDKPLPPLSGGSLQQPQSDRGFSSQAQSLELQQTYPMQSSMSFPGSSSTSFPGPTSLQAAQDAFGGFMTTATAALQQFDNQQPLSQQQLPAIIPNDTSPNSVAEDDEFGGFNNAVLTQPSQQQQQPQQQQQQGMDALDALAGGSITNTTLPGLSLTTMGMDALDALGPFENAPLPSLGGNSQPAAATVSMDDFGGFAAAPAPVVGMAAFGALDMPANTTNTTTNSNDDDDDDFGGFASATTTTTSPTTDTKTGLSALDALGPIENAPLQSLGGGGELMDNNANSGDDDDDDFGGFTDAAAAAPPSAMDAFGTSMDAPLPSLRGGMTPANTDDNGTNNANTDDDDPFGGFTGATAAPQQQQTSLMDEPSGMEAFDALAGVQDAPLPTWGMGQPQSEQVLGRTSTSPLPMAPAIQPSLSFPPPTTNDPFGDFTTAATTTTSDFSGMAAFDTLGPLQDAPLPSFGTKSEESASVATSEDLGDFVAVTATSTASFDLDPNESFGSFAAAEPNKRRLSGSLRRRSSRGLTSPETIPKDLMPSLPGERYVENVRKNSLRKLPECDLDGDDDNEQDDPFAGLDPAPGSSSSFDSFSRPIHLNEPSALDPAAETVPQDLKPHAPGEHYVPHCKDPMHTPGGLQNLEEQNNEDDDEDFGDFEEAPNKIPKIPSVNPAFEPDPFSTSMPHELKPHAPGEHYVAHTSHATRTPGGLETVAERSGAGFGLHEVHLSHLNPATTLYGVDSPMPHDLTPHKPGEHYVPHHLGDMATPGGLATVGETLDEMIADDFGDFASAGMPAIPSPVQLSRQATPAPTDLERITKKTSTIESATIQEGDEDEEEEGGDAFDSSFGMPAQMVIPPPTQIKRQATPMPQDLRPDLLGPTAQLSQQQSDLVSITESIEESRRDSLFGQDGHDTFAPPPELSRTATPAAQDLQPMTRKMNVMDSATIHEEDEDDADGFGDFNGPGTDNVPPPAQLSRTATPAAKDLDPLTKRNVSGGDLSGTVIQERDEENEEDDAFGGFEGTGVPGQMEIVAPPQMKRKETPRPQDIKPNLPGRSPPSAQPGLTSIGESFAETQGAIQEGDEKDSDSSSTASNDPFDALAPPPASLPPLSFYNTGASTIDTSQPSSAAPLELSRQATPSVQDLQPITRKTQFGGSAPPIQEGDEENNDDDNFGDFAEAQGSVSGSLGMSSSHHARKPPDLVEKESMELFVLQQTPLEPQHSSGSIGRLGFKSKSCLIEDDDDDDDEKAHAMRDLSPGRSRTPTRNFAFNAPVSFPSQESGEKDQEDDLGDSFGDFAVASEVPSPSKLARQATPAAQDLQPITRKMNVIGSATIQEADEDDFGDFENAGAGVPDTPPQLLRQATPAAKDLDPLTQKAPKADDKPRLSAIGEDLGEMGAESSNDVGISPPPELTRQATPSVQDLKPITQKPSAGGFGGAAIEEGDEEEDEEFGDFGNFEQAGEPMPIASAESDDFGGFPAAPAPAQAENDSQEFDAFGDFATPTPAPAETDEEFDAFGEFAATTPTPAPAESDGREFDEFGDFSGFSSTNPTPTSDDDQAFRDDAGATKGLRERIASLSLQLPGPLRQSIDHGKLFDVIIGTGTSCVTADQKKRADRCIQVLELVSAGGKHSKLASTHWMQAVEVVHNELSLGHRLLDEAASLSSQERKLTTKPLEVMLAGMGEYIRATRSIVASIGDMLLLDVSTSFTESTLDSAWGSIAIIKKALEVEKLWAGLVQKGVEIGLPPPATLETVVEIRTRCLSRCPSTLLCQLSLQPLSEEDKQTTKATVDWDGKVFMACSANFLANKCPFYVNNH